MRSYRGVQQGIPSHPTFSFELPKALLLYKATSIDMTKVYRKVARNCNLCLFVYSKLTCQNPNSSKSAIYFPSWFNRKLAKSVASIMNLKIGNFPFTYLGCWFLLEELGFPSFSIWLIASPTLLPFWNTVLFLKMGKWFWSTVHQFLLLPIIFLPILCRIAFWTQFLN